MATTLRRIISGHNEQARSVVVADKPPVKMGTLFGVWATGRAPCSYGSEDGVAERPPMCLLPLLIPPSAFRRRWDRAGRSSQPAASASCSPWLTQSL